jgi:integrase
MMLEKLLAQTPRGHKLLVPDDIQTDRAINQLQFFVWSNRGSIQAPDRETPLTFHGLRHTYAAEKYKELVSGGMGELDAHFAVSRLLGHERADVTNIYLVSVRKGGADGK